MYIIDMGVFHTSTSIRIAFFKSVQVFMQTFVRKLMKQVFVPTLNLPYPLKSYNYGLELQSCHGRMSVNKQIILYTYAFT